MQDFRVVGFGFTVLGFESRAYKGLYGVSPDAHTRAKLRTQINLIPKPQTPITFTPNKITKSRNPQKGNHISFGKINSINILGCFSVCSFAAVLADFYRDRQSTLS